MSFKKRCTISSSYEFQAHQQPSQRRFCFSQNALLWFEVLPDAPRFVTGAPRCSAMQRDRSPGRRAACNSPSEATRFRQSRQGRPEHPGVSDGNYGCCWCWLAGSHLVWGLLFGSNQARCLVTRIRCWHYPPPCTASIDSIPILNQTHSITAFKLACSLAPCLSPISLVHSLQVCTIMASKSISPNSFN